VDFASCVHITCLTHEAPTGFSVFQGPALPARKNWKLTLEINLLTLRLNLSLNIEFALETNAFFSLVIWRRRRDRCSAQRRSRHCRCRSADAASRFRLYFCSALPAVAETQRSNASCGESAIPLEAIALSRAVSQ
jgi:hypothetical protein